MTSLSTNQSEFNTTGFGGEAKSILECPIFLKSDDDNLEQVAFILEGIKMY